MASDRIEFVQVRHEEMSAFTIAQPPVTGTVIARAPGAGERVGGVTSDYLAFPVPQGVGNASGEPVRQNPDGTWSDNPGGPGRVRLPER